MRANLIRGCLSVAALIAGLAKVNAEEPKAKPETPEARQARLFKQFESTLTNAVLTGQFTVVGKEAPPRTESYTILSVRKMSQGDLWVFTARIKYGKHDVTLPKDRKSTRLNSSHALISYAVFCLKKKNKQKTQTKTKKTQQKHKL